MRHSWAIWVVSAAVSAGVHAGVISALARISIEGSKDEARSEVVLAGGSIAAVAAAAAGEATSLAASDPGQVLASAAEAEDVPVASDQGRLAGEASDTPAGSSEAGDAPSPEEVDTAVPAASGGEAQTGSAETAASPPAGGDLPEANEPSTLMVAKPSDAPVTASASDGAAASEAVAAAPAAPAEAGGDAGSVLPSAPERAATLPEGTKTASIITAVPEAMSQAEKIDRFLKSYGGGGCLYALPSALDAPRPAFGGFGAERGVLDFAAAFRKAVGVEPELAIRTVMEPQCPAVEFLRDIAALKPRSVEVVLDSDQVANGAMVTGHLDGDPGGEVRLLVVGDDGAVSDISADFHRMGGGNFFASPLLVNDAGRARNQIIVALISPAPLTIAANHVAGEARTLFADVARQAGTPGASVAIGFNSFRVE